MAKITMEELEEAIRAAELAGESRGFTTREFAQQIGMGDSSALRKLKTAMAAGIIRYIGKMPRRTFTGDPCVAPCFEAVQSESE